MNEIGWVLSVHAMTVWLSFPPTIFWLSPTLCSYREMALHLQLDQDAELEAATFLEMVVTASIPTESCIQCQPLL